MILLKQTWFKSVGFSLQTLLGKKTTRRNYAMVKKKLCDLLVIESCGNFRKLKEITKYCIYMWMIGWDEASKNFM